MSIYLEGMKMRRTGFLPAFLGGALFSSAFPVLNMAVRAEMFVGRAGSPVTVLLDANWQMMAMVNVLLTVTGACILYHTEYADGADLRMRSLPAGEIGGYLGKWFLLTAAVAVVLAVEAVSVGCCARHWFGEAEGIYRGLGENFVYFLFLMLPVTALSLWIASACRNMWIALGIGVIGIFIATVLPAKGFSLFPFMLPFQTLSGMSREMIRRHTAGVCVETAVIVWAEYCLVKIRRRRA